MPVSAGLNGMIAQDVTTASTTQGPPLGTRCRFPNSSGIPREFIYVKAGTDALTVGQWAVILSTGTSALLDTDTSGLCGPVGVAMGTVAAASYGWLQTSGPATAALNTSAATGAVYATSTGGTADSTVSMGNQIIRARTSVAESGGFGTVELSDPWFGVEDSHA